MPRRRKRAAEQKNRKGERSPALRACTEPAPRSPLLCAVDLACCTEHATLHQPASLHRPCTSPALSSLRPCASKPLCPARLQQPRALHRPCVTSPVGCNPLHQPGPCLLKKQTKRGRIGMLKKRDLCHFAWV
ncbi:hypothetical protein SLEP1_g60324 [Rubroshorea leprosula]|uniref:Uncharacterized protein n=1 Tax=Rubroshorea leprosula TaxID=152421 RepID=A0AAV5MWE8_9ROSI|nr:hypothetical protein SLEP1_g60324 [Rubroshorea leprosula]